MMHVLKFFKQNVTIIILSLSFIFQSEEFVLYASVCPTKLFGYTPPPRGYMFVIGFIRLLLSCFVACYRITPLDVFSILCHDDAFNLQSQCSCKLWQSGDSKLYFLQRVQLYTKEDLLPNLKNISRIRWRMNLLNCSFQLTISQC